MYLIFVAKTISIAPVIAILTAITTFTVVAIVNWLMTDDSKT